MAQVTSSVEQERLLAVVDTQKRHIDELRRQLQDSLEVQKQQQLQLVQQSPARKNVRKMLERAAADNTALAKRVEELRSQRNALLVTKAALTAQVSELIRVAAADPRREEQHQLLLHQLQHLCRLMQQPHLQSPGEQMAAVVAHIKQLYRERQELSGLLEAALRSTGQQHALPAAAAAAAARPPSSPTGLKLDQRATSQLIWTNGCRGLFAAQHKQQWTLAAVACAEAADSHSSVASGGSSSSCRTHAAECPGSLAQPRTAMGGPAAAAVSDKAPASSQADTSQLLDMSYLSPLRGAAKGTGSCNSKPAQQQQQQQLAAEVADAVPCNSALAVPPVTSACVSLSDVTSSTPLSAQSLSAFSSGAGGGSSPSPRLHRALQQLSPLRRCGASSTARHSTAAGRAPAASQRMAGSSCRSACSDDSSSSSSSSSSSRSQEPAAPSVLVTPAGAQPKQQGSMVDDTLLHTPAATAGVTAGSPAAGMACNSVPPQASGPAQGAPGPASCYSVTCSRRHRVVTFNPQPEFQLAAAGMLWPSPAAARSRPGGVAAALACSVSSHMLWLPDEEQPEAWEDDSSSELEEPLGVLCPRALTDVDFLCASADSCAEEGDGRSCVDDADAAAAELGAGAGAAVRKRRGRRRSAASTVLWLGVTVAAAAAAGGSCGHAAPAPGPAAAAGGCAADCGGCCCGRRRRSDQALQACHEAGGQVQAV